MPRPQPERNADGTLTRAGMEQIIQGGGSVMLRTKDGNVVVDNLAGLPSEVELAGQDADRLKAVLAAQEAELAARRRDLEATQTRLREVEEQKQRQPRQEKQQPAPDQPAQPQPPEAPPQEQAADVPVAQPWPDAQPEGDEGEQRHGRRRR